MRKEQCVGQAFPCTAIKILDASGEECSPDEVGELFSTSPYLFNGYWKRPEETEEAVHEGWLTVGDLAKKDSEGYLYIVDRKNDMVISGGVNIYPRETEEVLIRHPDILDVAVVGIADEKWGESIKAFLVTRNNIDLNLEAVRAFCEDKISTIKMPKAVNIIDEIPRNAGGKVLKKSLRKIN